MLCSLNWRDGIPSARSGKATLANHEVAYVEKGSFPLSVPSHHVMKQLHIQNLNR